MINDDIVGVNFICGELLNETFGLVQGQELGYTDTHKRGLFLVEKNGFYRSTSGSSGMPPITNESGTNRVFELAIDLRDHLTHGF